MPQTAPIRPLTQAKPLPRSTSRARRVGDLLSIAEQQGLLTGGRTQSIRARMPARLVAEAKKKTGIQSDSKLLEAALANITVADDYADWLLSQRATVSGDLDLEF